MIESHSHFGQLVLKARSAAGLSRIALADASVWIPATSTGSRGATGVPAGGARSHWLKGSGSIAGPWMTGSFPEVARPCRF